MPTPGPSEQGIEAGHGSPQFPKPSLSHPAKHLVSVSLSQRVRQQRRQPGGRAHGAPSTTRLHAGTGAGLAERGDGQEEAPPSAVGVLLASEVSEPGSSDPSSAGVCREDSGTYTVSPSEWPPLPTRFSPQGELRSRVFWSQKSLSVEPRWVEGGRMIKPQRDQSHPPTRCAPAPGSSDRHG